MITAYAQSLIDRKKNVPRQQSAAAEVSMHPALAAYPDLMTVSEVAGYLAISPSNLAGMIEEGRLLAMNIASPGASRPAWRIYRSSVAAFEHKAQVKAA